MRTWRPIRVALWALALTGPLADGASAQTGCTDQNQATLLSQFSDNASPGSIAPGNVRNIICSNLNHQGTGGNAVVLSPSSSPFIYTATYVGMVVASSGTMLISRNNGGTFYQFSTAGGNILMLVGDQIEIAYSGSPPVVVFLPIGPSS